MAERGIRCDDRVVALEDVQYTVYRKRGRPILKAGTPGRVLALRDDPDGRKALVKFKGFGWPKQIRIERIGKEEVDGQTTEV